MSEELRITTIGIKKTLSNVSREQAIAEYIWNGFDAGATIVELNAVPIEEGFDTLSHITIRDNGEGIPHPTLKQKFGPYLESLKAYKRSSIKNSDVQGQEGKGRLTFFRFSNSATWNTRFTEKGRRYAYTIKINADGLDKYDPSSPSEVQQANGTSVEFLGVHADFTL
ncbi:MAG: ATP-binding protein, partial [Verrucomicrobia bacterium]|nr:ATP-binding protein [Verrucomicrobiota bacterium]